MEIARLRATGGRPASALHLRRGLRSARAGDPGQSLAEFALIVPILLLLVLAIADFGRIYSSMVAVEAAAREAADYGAFQSVNWDASKGNPPITNGQMETRACTAAMGSHLDGFQGASDGTTCTNPAFACELVPPVGSGEAPQPCDTYSGTYCSTSTSDPPCTVEVTLTYRFDAFLDVPPLPTTVTFSRVSDFRISDLPVPTP